MTGLGRTVQLVAVLNAAYFVVEFAVAQAIGSVSLFADSIDFLEDASVNLLIAVALGWTARNRARLGMALAGILLVPGLATLLMAWEKFSLPNAPDPVPLSLAGTGALAVNLCCALCSLATDTTAAASRKRPSCQPGTTPSPTLRSLRPAPLLPFYGAPHGQI